VAPGGAGPYTFGGAILTGGELTTDKALVLGTLELHSDTLNRTGVGAGRDISVSDVLLLNQNLDMTGSTLTAGTAAVTVNNGVTLIIDSDVAARTMDLSNGGSFVAGGNTLTIGETLRINGASLALSDAPTFTAEWDDGSNKPDSVTLSGGTLTIGGLQGAPPGPLGHWSFDGDLTDGSGNGYDGEFYGNGGFSSDVPATIGSGQSLDLTSGGYDDVVVVDDGAGQTVFDLNAMTVSVWAKGWTVRTWSQYVSKSEHGWAVRTMPNYITLMLRGTSGPDDIAGTIEQPADVDEWYHIVATYDEATGTRKMWIDGELSIDVNEGADTTINDQPGRYLVFGGRDENGTIGYSSGMMLDEIYIYDRA